MWRYLICLAIVILFAACTTANDDAPSEVPVVSYADTKPLSVQDILDKAQPSPIPLHPPLRSPQPPRVIVLDPGHGGWEIGTVHLNSDGVEDLIEKELNLDTAKRLRKLLEARGYQVVLTRDADRRADPSADSLPDKRAIRIDLQARVDIANNANADLFISLHSNGSPDPAEAGVEVWYSKSRTFGDNNERLARLVHDRIMAALSDSHGYAANDRGIRDDANFEIWHGRNFPIFVLGPEREYRLSDMKALDIDSAEWGIDLSSLPTDEEDPVVLKTRATKMPGVLVEALFLTNDADAAVLKDAKARDTIVRAIADAIDAYFAPAQSVSSRSDATTSP